MHRAIAITVLLVSSPAFAGSLQCGDQRITVEPEGDGLRLGVGEESFALLPVVAASGAKYEAADDPSTSFWSKGERGLLELRGQSYPECLPVPAAAFRASGNEPFWSLEITEEALTLVTQLGESRLVAATPQPERSDGVTRYAVEADGRALTVTLLDQRCADTMTGMPHPSTIVVTVNGEELRGCGGDPASLLRGVEWAVLSIDGEPPVEGSEVSIAFGGDGHVSGAASCNRFMGAYALSGEGLSLTQVATTMMACPEPIMAQEQRFLALLGEVNRFEIGDQGRLLLHTGDGRSLQARRP